MAVMMIVGVLGLSAPAQAWTADSSYSELSFPTYTDNNFNVVLSGRIQPAAAGRPVSLQANGAYAAQVTTDAYGRFSFVRNVTSTTTFKFFSAKQAVGANFYGPAGTGEYTVYPAPPVVHNSVFSGMSVPSYTDIDNRVTITGNLGPGGGRQVTFYKQQPDGSNDTYITATTTDANGWFSFTTSIFEPRRFRFYTQQVPAGPNTYFANASYVTGVVSPPATQASSYSELSFPATAGYNGTATFSGRILPAVASRQVNLYRDGAYFRTTSTDSTGRFSFPGVVITNRASFKFFSAKHRVSNGLYYEAQGTGEYAVNPAPTRETVYSELSTPEYTHWSGNGLVTVSGRISQASAGRVVSLYKEDGTRVAGALTDASGRFVFSDLYVPVVTSFNFWSEAQSSGGITYASKRSDNTFRIKSVQFQEDFNYSDLSFIGDEGSGAKWTLRQQNYPTGGERLRSKGSREAMQLFTEADGRTVLRLGIKRAPASDELDGVPRYLTGHIVTSVRHDYSHFEANVKFHRFQGGHSGFWLQSGYEASATTTHHEFDIAERFNGDSIVHTVWRNIDTTPGDDRIRYPVDGPMRTTPDSAGWFDQYHVVRGRWNAQGYAVQVDDGPWETVNTAGFVGQQKPQLILSLLINDDKINELPSTLPPLFEGLTVDWVRTWR